MILDLFLKFFLECFRFFNMILYCEKLWCNFVLLLSLVYFLYFLMILYIKEINEYKLDFENLKVIDCWVRGNNDFEINFKIIKYIFYFF